MAKKVQGSKGAPGASDPVDIHVGQRIRLRRTMQRMSQEKLAAQLGITFQQVQKYEWGANGVRASRLYAIARILGVNIQYFYEGYTGEGAFGVRCVSEEVTPLDASFNCRETTSLLNAYYAVESKDLRRKIVEMMKEMTDALK